MDVSNLPKNTYLRQFSDKDDKELYTELVLANELDMNLKIKMVRPYDFGTGCNKSEI